MKRFAKIALVVALMTVIAVAFTGCRQAERVSYNLSKQADNFNVTRRVAVFNLRTDTVLLEVIGNLSVQQSAGDIDIVIETGPGQYKKHFVRLNEWTAYVVEDISGSSVSSYHYEINFLPETLVPITFTMDY